jgi:hypothetical protein
MAQHGMASAHKCAKPSAYRLPPSLHHSSPSTPSSPPTPSSHAGIKKSIAPPLIVAPLPFLTLAFTVAVHAQVWSPAWEPV